MSWKLDQTLAAEQELDDTHNRLTNLTGLTHHFLTIPRLFGLRNYLFDPPHLPVGQPHLDAVGVIRGLGEDVLHLSPGELARPLVLLQDDHDLSAPHYIAPDPSVGLHSPAMCCSQT